MLSPPSPAAMLSASELRRPRWHRHRRHPRRRRRPHRCYARASLLRPRLHLHHWPPPPPAPRPSPRPPPHPRRPPRHRPPRCPRPRPRRWTSAAAHSRTHAPAPPPWAPRHPGTHRVAAYRHRVAVYRPRVAAWDAWGCRARELRVVPTHRHEGLYAAAAPHLRVEIARDDDLARAELPRALEALAQLAHALLLARRVQMHREHRGRTQCRERRPWLAAHAHAHALQLVLSSRAPLLHERKAVGAIEHGVSDGGPRAQHALVAVRDGQQLARRRDPEQVVGKLQPLGQRELAVAAVVELDLLQADHVGTARLQLLEEARPAHIPVEDLVRRLGPLEGCERLHAPCASVERPHVQRRQQIIAHHGQSRRVEWRAPRHELHHPELPSERVARVRSRVAGGTGPPRIARAPPFHGASLTLDPRVPRVHDYM
eukprot:scaffold47655_cov58-Phaeocystis_antarctica.AAC.2